MAIQGSHFSHDHYRLPGSGTSMPVNIPAFNSLNISDETEVIGWLKDSASQLCDYYGSYRSLWHDNINIYTGASMRPNTIWNGEVLARDTRGSTVTNLLRPIVETHVSRLTSSRANVSVLPVHSGEFHDLSAAKTAEAILQMSFKDRRIDQKLEHAARTMLVCGAAYMLVDWNNHIGPAVSQIDQEIPVMDDRGEVKVDEKGNPITIRPDLRIGDVDYRMLRPDQVLEQPGRWGQDPDWVIIQEVHDVYRLRELFPTIADQIKPGDLNSPFSGNRGMRKTNEDQTVVYTLLHRSTPSLPHGRRLVATPDVILENTDLPFPTLNKYGKLPICRLDDTHLSGYDLPMPLTVMEAGKPYQLLHNRANQTILRNMSISTPKWIVNSGAGVRLAHLNNQSNIVQYKGDASMAPRLDSPKSTPNEVFGYRDQLGNEMQIVTGASHILNVPPPNTRAAAMLEHQEEQEFKRAEPLIKHYNNFQADIAQIAIAIMADMYDESDERMLKLSPTGSSTAFLRLKTADLMGPFDIRFERTSALPESKQGRLNAAMQMFQMGLIDEQQYKKVIGYSADPDLADATAKAYEKQLLEIDLMIRGHEIQAPVEHEDHVEHLRALYPVVQSIEFSEMPPEIQQKLVIHTMAHEMFAWRRAQISQIYALKVLKHCQWLFFSALPEAMPVGVDNPGTPIENLAVDRLTTPGLVQPTRDVVPSPDNPEAV